MKLFTKIKLSYFFGFMLVAFIYTPITSASYQENTFNKLGEILQAKKNDIILRLTIEKEKVANIKNDHVLQNIFKSI